MKAAIGVIGAAVAASACCIGPVVFSLLGAGALGASAVKLEAYRPWFLGLTLVLVGAAFYSAYRPAANESCAADGTCAPGPKRAARIMVWIAAALAVLLIAFPYYIGYLM
jgi:mercuric ion transport protein